MIKDSKEEGEKKYSLKQDIDTEMKLGTSENIKDELKRF